MSEDETTDDTTTDDDAKTPAGGPGRHMTPEEFRRYGRQVVDWIADYHETIERHPVLSRVEPGEIAARMPAAAPEEGEPFEALLGDLDEVVLPGITHWQAPGWFAYFPSNASFPSMLGELLSAGLGVQGMLWATSPACTEVETRVLDWLVPALGLPEAYLSTSTGGGVIQDTASSASLCALLAARERATGGESNAVGCRGDLVAYTSTQAHSSIEKAARIAGIGHDHLRSVPVDGRYRLDPTALAAMVEEDRAAGKTPFFVAATVGTTSSLAVDPVEEIAAVCRDHGLWLHVDAAMAGTAALCPEHRDLHAGVEHADSYCFNPHKWMFTNFDCDCFWVRDRAALIGALSILPEYLKNAATESGAVIDYRDWQVPLGRRFRALKLWFVLRWYGLEGLRRAVRAHVELAARFAGWVEDDPDFELATPRVLNLVCFRHRGGDAVNRELLERLNAEGTVQLTHTVLDGRHVLRLCVGQMKTEERHVREAWRLIRAFGAEAATRS